MNSGNESQDTSIPEYDYIYGGRLENFRELPYSSRETSPEIENIAAVKMGDADALKVLKNTRTAAKAKFTNLQKAIVNMLNTPRLPVDRVETKEKEFQDAFQALNDAHSLYVAGKAVPDEDPQDAAYMDTPLTLLQEVNTKWADWHSAHVEFEQNALRADREKTEIGESGGP